MFNEIKTTQAAARLLMRAGGTMNYMVLIKMLYLADRKALRIHARSITGDTYYSMFLGPVLSATYDVATEPQDPAESHYWTQFISPPENYSVKLIGDPGDGKLSELEEGILDAAFERFKCYLDAPFDFSKWLHKNLPEVKEVLRGERIPLPLTEVLAAVHKSNEEVEGILSELAILDQVSVQFIAR
jgi:hypothetical protein